MADIAVAEDMKPSQAAEADTAQVVPVDTEVAAAVAEHACDGVAMVEAEIHIVVEVLDSQEAACVVQSHAAVVVASATVAASSSAAWAPVHQHAHS